MDTKLIISLPFSSLDEDGAKALALDFLQSLLYATKEALDFEPLDNAQVALLRDGDRSGGNLLLPKLEGRLGNHYQGRKATIQEILK